MAGSSPDFDPEAFRTSIRATMVMGLPVDEALRPTFRWVHRERYAITDATGRPLDWTAEALSEAPGLGLITEPAPPRVVRGPVQVPCSVEVTDGPVDSTSMGTFNADRAVLGVLDVDYPAVAGFDEVLLGGNVYLYDKELPPVGLYEVTFHQFAVVARDES
jgi:hypothetical protein